MAISKKIRFEVFKRDSFKCAYCGNSPPNIILEIDHIQPKSKKGNDDINNLITACFDCNRGKTNIPLDKIPSKLRDNLDVLIEQETQLKEYRKFIDKIEKRIKNDINDINQVYVQQYIKWEFSDKFKNVSLRLFLNKLPKHKIIEALNIAINKCPNDATQVIPYFCGVCWKMIKGDTCQE